MDGQSAPASLPSVRSECKYAGCVDESALNSRYESVLIQFLKITLQ